jgi:hypothetical protein
MSFDFKRLKSILRIFSSTPTSFLPLRHTFTKERRGMFIYNFCNRVFLRSVYVLPHIWQSFIPSSTLPVWNLAQVLAPHQFCTLSDPRLSATSVLYTIWRCVRYSLCHFIILFISCSICSRRDSMFDPDRQLQVTSSRVRGFFVQDAPWSCERLDPVRQQVAYTGLTSYTGQWRTSPDSPYSIDLLACASTHHSLYSCESLRLLACRLQGAWATDRWEPVWQYLPARSSLKCLTFWSRMVTIVRSTSFSNQ